MTTEVMDRKVVIVTGGNSGLGLETSKRLCELGHDVVISVRDESKGSSTVKHIKTFIPHADIAYIVMELSEPNSIQSFVQQFKATGKRLNVLLNNAGCQQSYPSSTRASARNDPTLERVMTANCIGTFLLTQLLLDELKATGTEDSPSRIVNVSSALTLRPNSSKGEFYIDDLMLSEQGHYVSGFQSYRNSKIGLNLWSNQMAEQLRESNVIVNTVCPGFIPSTNLVRETVATWRGTLLMYVLDSFIGRYMVGLKPVAEGVQRLVSIVLENQTKTTGSFYRDGQPASEEAEEVRNPENVRKIWGLCTKYAGL